MSDVTSYRVTGDWRHIVDDGMTDPDSEPDHVYPSGHVLFEAIDPDVAQAGDPTLAYTLASVTAPIVKGILVDNEDREGIWLAGLIGDTPVTWRATTHLEYAGQPLDYPVLEFELVRDTHITGIEPHDGGYRISTTAAPADVVSHPVTGDWRHIVDDGMVDLDALPDEALPTGKVTFHPVWPAVATAGDPAVAYTFATVTALVAAGELRDLQGRSGVWLAARVGVTPIQWRAVTEVEFQGQKIKLPPVELVLDGPARLTSLYRDSTVWPAPVVTAVEGHRLAAEDAADRAETAAESVDAAIEGAADQVVARVEGDRVAAEQAASDAAGSASAASGSASAAAGSASDAAASAVSASSSAVAASGSAGDASGSATAAAGSASAAADSASTASQGAQVITDNLAAIEAAPGHAADAQTARGGAEDARDAAAGSASAAEGSAAAAAGSASDAATSATAADGSATAAAGSATTAAGHAGTASTQAGVAEGHAQSAAGSASSAASDAGRAETAADSFGLSVTTSTGAPGSNAAVTVSGDGPSYTLGFTVPQGAKGDKGDDGEVSQAMLDAAVATLVDGAPEALDTLTELAAALGNDPNFATTTAEAIGKRVLIDGAPAAYNTLGKLVTALQNHELGGSTDASLLTGALTDAVDASAAFAMVDLSEVGGPSELQMQLSSFGAIYVLAIQNQEALEGKADAAHTHTKTQVGLGNVDNTSDANKPVSTAQQAALTPLQNRVGAAPATWRWNGTTLPTAASQVHAQARAGDFIVAPNLTVDPGWHQITGV